MIFRFTAAGEESLISEQVMIFRFIAVRVAPSIGSEGDIPLHRGWAIDRLISDQAVIFRFTSPTVRI